MASEQFLKFLLYGVTFVLLVLHLYLLNAAVYFEVVDLLAMENPAAWFHAHEMIILAGLWDLVAVGIYVESLG